MPDVSSPPSVELTLASDLTRTDQIGGSYRIAYKQQQKVYVTDLRGSKPRRLFEERSHSLNCPLAWSSDGTTVYVSHRQIYALNASTGEKRAVTDFHGKEQFSANWLLQRTPDGTALVFLSVPTMPKPRLLKTLLNRNKPEPSRLCLLNIADTTVRTLFTAEEERLLWKADAQPSSNLAIALVFGKGVSEIWAVNTDGTNRTKVAEADEKIADIALAPDGKQIACEIDSGIGLMTIGKWMRRQLTPFGHKPVWSPDSKQLAFLDSDHSLWTVDVEGGEPQRRVWFDGPHPSQEERRGSYSTHPVWSADGRLLWFRLTRTRWQEELDEKSREYLAQLERNYTGKCFSGVPEAEIERMRRHSVEQAHWKTQHCVGILDVAEHKVWYTDGYWSNVAWSPR